MTPFIKEPVKIPLLLRLGIFLSEKLTGKRMLPARLLAWSPRLALGAAVFESLVVHKDPTLSKRLLKLLRMQVSLQVGCPFCIDMNSAEYEHYSISKLEIEAMQGRVSLDEVDSFNAKEKLALKLARNLSSTPLGVNSSFINEIKLHFDDREILVLNATAAQVNYWARLIQSLGVPPAGFVEESNIISIKELLSK